MNQNPRPPAILALALVALAVQAAPSAPVALYTFNRAPLAAKPYTELPLGAISARGWLEDELKRMAAGMTGHLDTWYPQVCGSRNAWLGGDGDTWERGPYWIDGLYPLARLLRDDALIAKAMLWVEWTLNNQREDGYIGPRLVDEQARQRPPPKGAQVEQPDDWWPRMVMLKILQQHYSATGDPRVIAVMRKYFRYQLTTLPTAPLKAPPGGKGGSWWAEQRGGDNLMSVLWLYNLTGDAWLLDLGNLIHQQTLPFTQIFLAGDALKRTRDQREDEETLPAYGYGPSTVTARVADGVEVTMTEDTHYPFEETIRFRLATKTAVTFPLHLRIPAWCREATVLVNGATERTAKGGRVAIVSRPWRDGDRIELRLPMTIRTSKWYENSVAIERGPLVYALRLTEQWSEVKRPGPDPADPTTPRGYLEVRTPDPWNFALLQSALNEPAKGFEVVRTGAAEANPWSFAGAPLELRTQGVRLAHWTLYLNSAGPVPLSPNLMPAGGSPTPIRLVPYGCTTLRIAAFPWIDDVKKFGRP